MRPTPTASIVALPTSNASSGSELHTPPAQPSLVLALRSALHAASRVFRNGTYGPRALRAAGRNRPSEAGRPAEQGAALGHCRGRECVPALLGALLVPVAVGGCGGSGASKASVTARAHTAAGQYAALASFGHPAATSERAEIAGRLRAFLAATANGNAAKRCRLLAGATRARVGTMFARTHQSCRRVLGAVAARLTARQRAELTTARLTAVRIEGNHGYALYRTTADARNVIPLLRERGSWGIAALAGTSL